MHCHTGDVDPDQRPRSLETKWSASILVHVPPKACKKGKAILQTAQENIVLPMERDLRTSFPDFQEDHSHTASFELTQARSTPTPVSLIS